MDTAAWFLRVAMAAVPVAAIMIAAFLYYLRVNKRLDEQDERHLPPAE
jgi:hypothetical protein